MKKPFCAVLILTTGFFINSCSSEKQEIDLDANRDVVRHYHRIWSDGKLMNWKK